MAYSRTLNHFTSMQELATIWASGTSYLVNQLVVRNNFLYRCAIAHTSSGSFQTDQAAGDWERVSSAENAIGWATGIYYVLNQLVIDSDKLYKCLVAHTSGATFIADLQSSYWVEISASEAGVFNYIGNADAEVDTSGWSTYADAAGTQPVDGSGGSPAITFSRSTTTPLRGDADFNLVKGGSATRQGNGVAYDFTIDRADLAKVLTVTFDYEILSGTYATGDLTVYIIQDPAGTPVVIQPAGYQVQAATAGTTMKHIATFQTASSVTSYRLCIHVATTSALDYSLAIDNVVVGPQVVQYGAPVTDWVSFTPTGSWTNNTTYTGKWRRVGDSLEGQVDVTLSGAPNAVALSLNLPFGFSIDPNKITNTTSGNSLFGHARLRDASGSGRILGDVSYNTSTQLYVFALTSGSNAEAVVTATYPITFATGDNITIHYKVPILGWSSTVQMSNDTDTRVVAARYAASGSRTPTSVKAVNYDTKTLDTHSAVTTVSGDVAGWRFTAPIPGIYKVASISYQAVAASASIVLYKNGSFYCYLQTVNNATINSASTIIELISGDYIDVRSDGTPTLTFLNQGNTISIERLSGPSAIAASETVAAKYQMAVSQTISASPTYTRINFGTKEYDSHGSVITGASWLFTVPVSGIYEVTGAIRYTATSVVNSVIVSIVAASGKEVVDTLCLTTATTNSKTFAGTASLLAGDTFYLQCTQNSGGTVTLGSGDSYISIQRIGNYV